MTPLLFALLMSPPDAVVGRPVANMYSKPTIDADVVSQAIYSTPVTVLEEQGEWRRIRTPDDYTGWVEGAAIRAGEYAVKGKVARVASMFAHLYREASVTKHQPLLTVPFETRLEVVAEPESDKQRWLQVRLIDDRAAWVQRGDLTFDETPLSIQEAIHLAVRFLGLPYTWGGTSSYGYDCSGFTQMLCRRRGTLIPRDAGPQALWEGMAQVERTDLSAGDLVYFGSSAEKIDHTGMYIGNGEFIHATVNMRPVVQISRLGDEPWTTRLVACRRIK